MLILNKPAHKPQKLPTNFELGSISPLFVHEFDRSRTLSVNPLSRPGALQLRFGSFPTPSLFQLSAMPPCRPTFTGSLEAP
jgi:hypothetical protein